MTAQPNISVPNTTLSTAAKPYTLYNITVQLPLHPVTITKRYSDFLTLHSALTTQASSTPPPAPLPGKSWFTRTTSSPALTETRRQGLETYLRAINEADDDRWRNTSAWRTFLNLPSSSTSRTNSSRSNPQATINSRSVTTDPVLWLDQHKELKSQLHDARLALTKRDQAQAVQAQHEAAAQAKKCLVRAGTMIASLDKGLEGMRKGRMGDGEMRRRKDLVATARKEREGLESLAGAMATKAALDRSVAGAEADRGQLLDTAKGLNGSRGGVGGGRVLGKETDRTRALNNEGVVQLQKQLMLEQDQDVDVLAQAVRKQKELGIQIQEELEVQKDMLTLVGEDVDRVEGKLGVARKRVGKIS